MSVGSSGGTALAGAIKIDLRRLHETWMELLFPRQRGTGHSLLGKWTPNTTGGWIAYRLWGALGAPIVVVLYPLALLGFAARFYARRINQAAAGLGALGAALIAALTWGALSVAARYQFSTRGFLAVLAAAVVATVCSGLAVLFSRIGGRITSIAFAYPAATTALFLPPVAAALASPTLGSLVLPGSYSIAVWLLENVLHVGGLNDLLRARYELAGAAYLGMWFALAVPLGWILGITVALADLARPS